MDNKDAFIIRNVHFTNIFSQYVYEVPLQRILEVSSVYLWGGYLNEISHNVKNVPISRSYLDKYEMLYEQPKRVLYNNIIKSRCEHSTWGLIRGLGQSHT